MESILFLIVFIVIFLVYMHIIRYYRISQNNIVHSIVYSKETLNECCDSKQPVIFDNIFENVNYDDFFQGSHNYNLKNSEETFNQVPLYLQQTIIENLMQNNSKYFSENNHNVAHDILCGSLIDVELRPKLCVNTTYDILLGSQKTRNFYNYHKHHSMFLFVYSGKIRLHTIQPQHDDIVKYENNYDNMTYGTREEGKESQQVLINENQICFIPPFMLYNIEYIENSKILVYSYDNIGSFVSQIPDYGLYYLHRFSNGYQETFIVNENSLPSKDSVEVKIESDNGNENLEVIEE